MRRILLLILAAQALTPALAQTAAPPAPKDQGDRYSGAAQASRSAVVATQGMAATSQPLATQVAIDILKAGGSAVDAAIAANAALGLMEPTGNGIGGDLFAIIRTPDGKLHGLNASGRAPAGQSLRQLQAKTRRTPRAAQDVDDTIADWGAASVTIPGAVDGWFTMHAKFGKLPMQRNLAPAIRYAQVGFPVSELIAKYWATGTTNFEKLGKAGVIEEVANMRRLYLPGGKAPVEGEIFKNPDLALTLIEIAEGGRDAFYTGSLAKSMDGYFRRIRAPHRLADFAAHKSEWVEPIATDYRGSTVYELPPNSQGITALQLLNILEGYDLKAMGRGSADFWHVFVEAKKRAFADRARLYGDPAFGTMPLAALLSKDRAKRQRDGIDMKASAIADAALPIDGATDTIYLTVADKDGMMVSLIQSNYRGMGSGLVPDDSKNGRTLGFMFQDRGAQFSLDAKHANAYAPGKRPFHTIIPAFMKMSDGSEVSFGLMGGGMQPQGHAQIVVNMVDFGMGVQVAGDAARFHHDGSSEPEGGAAMDKGGKIEIESGVPATIAEELRKRGHVVEYTTGPFGGYQAIRRDKSGVYWGASEFRKDGQAAGY